ncbi:hypothetical protein [Bacillus xiapuensis]|uniref:Transposase n=1 Tax=Bacillus xiapuensis TaxID=2014075 RepID=A0ABU6NBV1_9BACI|nr:hypothetical protein [Bacillus xiapuensis]
MKIFRPSYHEFAILINAVLKAIVDFRPVDWERKARRLPGPLAPGAETNSQI